MSPNLELERIGSMPGITRRQALTGLAAASATLGGWPVLGAAPLLASEFVAFSLRRAAEIAGRAPADRALKTLGGITRVAGVVYDPAGDVILVGLAAPSLPTAEFDYLITALKSRFECDQFPLVSIDPVADTAKTGLQQVRFVGPLADTAYGRDFLACDVVLKRYALSLIKTVEPVPSYNRLLETDLRRAMERQHVRLLGVRWETGAEAAERFADAARQRGARVQQSLSSQARFWFFVKMPPRTDCEPDQTRPEIFSIRELELCLRYELDDGDPLMGQYAREEFSRRFGEHFAAVAQTHPILQRLKILYDLTAAADAIHTLDRNVATLPYVRRLLSHYAAAATSTNRHHPLEECFGLLQRSDGLPHGVRVCGGIEFVQDQIADRVENLGYGILTELRALVLGSRPAEDALSWRVPLEGWRMPNGVDLGLPARRDWDQIPWRTNAGRQSGASLRTESVVLAADSSDAGQPVFGGFSAPVAAPPPRGVSMRIDVTKDSFRDAPDGVLESSRESMRGVRPDDGSLSWPAPFPVPRSRR
jgi:hypothetical protein